LGIIGQGLELPSVELFVVFMISRGVSIPLYVRSDLIIIANLDNGTDEHHQVKNEQVEKHVSVSCPLMMI
jgi:hypothetical protein